MSIHRLCSCVDEQAFTGVWYAAEAIQLAASSQLQASLLAALSKPVQRYQPTCKTSLCPCADESSPMSTLQIWR